MLSGTEEAGTEHRTSTRLHYFLRNDHLQTACLCHMPCASSQTLPSNCQENSSWSKLKTLKGLFLHFNGACLWVPLYAFYSMFTMSYELASCLQHLLWHIEWEVTDSTKAFSFFFFFLLVFQKPHKDKKLSQNTLVLFGNMLNVQKQLERGMQR